MSGMVNAVPAVINPTKLGLAAGLILLAGVLGFVLADQAPNMAGTSTLTLHAEAGSNTAGGVSLGHSR